MVGAVKRGAGQVMHALGNTRVGQAVKQGYNTVRNTVNKGKARVEQWQKDREAKKNAGKTPEEIAKEKQDKLDKAVAAIQPAVTGMLQKGVPSLILKARLLAWRVQHRLTSLAIENNQIVAKINPQANVAAVVAAEGALIRELTHAVVEELLSEQKVQDAAARMKKNPDGTSNDGTAEHPYQISGPQGFPGVVAQYRRVGPDGQITMGHDAIPKGVSKDRFYQVNPGGHDVKERLDWRGGTNSFVGDVGTYQEIHTTIQGIMSAKKLNDQDIARAIRGLVQTGRVPPGLMDHEQAEKLSHVTFLMFGREAVRDPATLAMAPMMLTLVGTGKIKNWQDALTQFPMSPPGSPAAYRRLLAEQKNPRLKPGSKASQEAAALKQREINMALQWFQTEFETKMRAEKMTFANDSECRTYIREHAKEFIRDKIYAFYRI